MTREVHVGAQNKHLPTPRRMPEQMICMPSKTRQRHTTRVTSAAIWMASSQSVKSLGSWYRTAYVITAIVTVDIAPCVALRAVRHGSACAEDQNTRHVACFWARMRSSF